MAEINGACAPGYESVKAVFERNFSEHDEIGAAVCIYHRGEKVVDLWGGVADRERDIPWEEDTLQLVFSTTKGITTLCVLRLIENGWLDLDKPVADYWQEFGQAGKENITLRMVLSHRAGLPVVDEPLTLSQVLQGDPVVKALERQTPYWPPDSKHGYHGLTFGWLLGEIVRRTTDLSVGNYFRQEIGKPLDLDLWIGLPEEYEPRVSAIIELGSDDVEALQDEESLTARMLMSKALAGTGANYVWNTRALHASEMPAVNGICTARSLAKLYAATVCEVDGRQLIEPQTVRLATEEQSNGPDASIGFVETRFGLGFHLDSPFIRMLGPRSFGHPGAGGSIGFADPDHGIGFGYVMNRLGPSAYLEPRAIALIDALRSIV